jgi:hypothetical protein
MIGTWTCEISNSHDGISSANDRANFVSWDKRGGTGETMRASERIDVSRFPKWSGSIAGTICPSDQIIEMRADRGVQPVQTWRVNLRRSALERKRDRNRVLRIDPRVTSLRNVEMIQAAKSRRATIVNSLPRPRISPRGRATAGAPGVTARVPGCRMLPPMVSRMLLRFPVRPKRRAIEIKNVAEISSVRPVAQTDSIHNPELRNLELRGDLLRARRSRVAENILTSRALDHGIKTARDPGSRPDLAEVTGDEGARVVMRRDEVAEPGGRTFWIRRRNREALIKRELEVDSPVSVRIPILHNRAEMNAAEFGPTRRREDLK